MLEKTRGIFLHAIPYSDNSIIARIYTERFGQQAYLVRGVRSKKSAAPINLFQPLFLLDLEVYHKNRTGIQSLKNARLSVPFNQLPFDIGKSAQAIFLAEILMKCLREEEGNPELFSFLFHAACLLDLADEGQNNFLISVLFRLTRFLGVAPQQPPREPYRFFDLISASFKQQEPVHHSFMDVECSAKFAELFEHDLSGLAKLSFNNRIRRELLDSLLEYYKIHLDLSGDFKSLAVLKEVLS
ncbi:DNA repair protein RecO [Mangrovibacterium marinum]|uniref:DNA repair protein RecO n=1 Tax=Mangrovibacterium marinum TaxID=1639118 RepID=A0A2T5C2X1_9BACT|nr:DNA repair protein RecO [Mangrovibacterium marinum]PTN09084.1 DNA replication and repair protein RecO [Mangrovibacterium marinum]